MSYDSIQKDAHADFLSLKKIYNTYKTTLEHLPTGVVIHDAAGTAITITLPV